MGTLCSLLLAASLQSAGDIRTGADLLAACSQSDTQACDEFVLHSRYAKMGCAPFFEVAEYRSEEREQLVYQLGRHPSLQRTAAEHALYQIGNCELD